MQGPWRSQVVTTAPIFYAEAMKATSQISLLKTTSIVDHVAKETDSVEIAASALSTGAQASFFLEEGFCVGTKQDTRGQTTVVEGVNISLVPKAEKFAFVAGQGAPYSVSVYLSFTKTLVEGIV